MPSKIKLYGFWSSAATYRVRIALALKGLEFEEVSLDLLAGEQFGKELAGHNPQNAVPVLLDGGPPLTQSLAIIDYLEQRKPAPTLFPTDPYMRAAAISFALITIADSHPFHVPRVRKQLNERFGASDAEIHSWSCHWQTQALAAMEKRLLMRSQPTPFCYGDQPSIADIGLASHVTGAMTFNIDLEPYALIAQIFEHCHKLEAFRAHSPQALKPA